MRLCNIHFLKPTISKYKQKIEFYKSYPKTVRQYGGRNRRKPLRRITGAEIQKIGIVGGRGVRGEPKRQSKLQLVAFFSLLSPALVRRRFPFISHRNCRRIHHNRPRNSFLLVGVISVDWLGNHCCAWMWKLEYLVYFICLPLWGR